jgi:hypothetical protein
MRSLYEVFKAIQADEGDHVATMKACLDPNVALRSPALERRLLTGFALLAAVSLAVSVGGTPTDIAVDNLSAAAEGSAYGTALDALIAGAATVASQVFGVVANNDGTVDSVEGIVEGAEALEASTIVTRIVAGLAGLAGAAKAAGGMGAKNESEKDQNKLDE